MANTGVKSITMVHEMVMMLSRPASWVVTRTTGPDGAEEHYFALIAVGHGIASLPTLVRIPRGGGRAVIVQADTMKLCENYGLQDRTALCRNTRQALADIARRLDARFAR